MTVSVKRFLMPSEKEFAMGRPPSYDHTMLLREIIDCLWERGYAATPISVIVQETGVNADFSRFNIAVIFFKVY